MPRLNHSQLQQFALVTWRPYCHGRPEKLCFTTLSLAVETMGVRLSVVKQSFFGLPGQYGRRVTRANSFVRNIFRGEADKSSSFRSEALGSSSVQKFYLISFLSAPQVLRTQCPKLTTKVNSEEIKN